MKGDDGMIQKKMAAQIHFFGGNPFCSQTCHLQTFDDAFRNLFSKMDFQFLFFSSPYSDCGGSKLNCA